MQKKCLLSRRAAFQPVNLLQARGPAYAFFFVSFISLPACRARLKGKNYLYTLHMRTFKKMSAEGGGWDRRPLYLVETLYSFKLMNKGGLTYGQ
jgi:hypothetical protein